MSEKRDQQAERQLSPPPNEVKRPYQKPAFRYERVFETMALACGKIQPTQQPCISLQKAS